MTTLRTELAPQDQAWRLGYEAGRRDHWWRKVPEVAWIAGGLATLWALTRSHRAHPLLRIVAFYGLLLAARPAIVLSPVLAAISIVRQHRRRHDWRRTGLLAGSWLGGFSAVALAYLTLSAWWLLVPALFLIAWHGLARVQREQRLLYRPPAPPFDEPPFTDADRRPGMPTPADHRKENRR
jgi:hypothetical protein